MARKFTPIEIVLGAVAVLAIVVFFGNLDTESADKATQARAGAVCPPTARAQVDQALRSGALRMDVVVTGVEIYMSRFEANALGPTGLDALALQVDCAIAGESAHVRQLTIQSAVGGTVHARYQSTDLLRIRERYTAGVGR